MYKPANTENRGQPMATPMVCSQNCPMKQKNNDVTVYRHSKRRHSKGPPTNHSVSSNYVDDTFMIWPHGHEKPGSFLLHLNSIHTNIQFTMKTERNGHITFPDIDVYR
jgi:hypothetical protein